jgi:hypothetical protein
VIKGYCFLECRSLDEVVVEANSILGSIEEYAFHATGLETLSIPKQTKCAPKLGIPQSRIAQCDSAALPQDKTNVDGTVNLGRCQLIRALTADGHVELYQDPDTNKQFTVKTLPALSKPRAGRDIDEFCSREVMCLRSLSHGCIVPFVAYCRSSGRVGPRIVTEFINGRLLTDAVLDSTQKAIVVAGIVSAMSHNHPRTYFIMIYSHQIL